MSGWEHEEVATMPGIRTRRSQLAVLRGLAIRVAALVRAASTHAPDSRALAELCEGVEEAAAPVLSELGELRIHWEGRRLRVNGGLVSEPGHPGYPELAWFAENLAQHGAAGLRLLAPPSRRDLSAFLRIWRDTEGLGDNGWYEVRAALQEGGIVTIDLLDPGDLADELQVEADSHDPEDVLQAHAALLTVAERLVDPAEAARPETLRRSDAALQLTADMVGALPLLVLAVTTIRAGDQYEVVHAVNTTLLAMLLGRHLNLGIEAVLNVGRGALTADLGMTRCAASVRDLPGWLGWEERNRVVAHPAEGFVSLFGGGPLDPGRRARAVVAWEHHTGNDGEGYPRPAPGGVPHLFSRIVAIADAYDALVHDRGDRAGLPRPLALEALWSEAGARFDRMVLGAFMSMLGRYPPGSVVRLRDGTVGLCAMPAADSRLFDRPLVYVIRDRAGDRLDPVQALDLSTQLGERATRVVETLDDRLFPERVVPFVFGL